MSLLENSHEIESRIFRKKYVSVAVNTTHPTYMSFSYAVPFHQDIAIGEVVHVPFGRLVLQGIVIDGPFDTPGYNPSEVRFLETTVSNVPSIPKLRMDLAKWLQRTYLTPLWDAYSVFLPPGSNEKPITFFKSNKNIVQQDLEKLSDSQKVLLRLIDSEMLENDSLRRKVRKTIPASQFNSDIRALLRKKLIDRNYKLQEPRGKPRTIEIVRLLIDPSQAKTKARLIEGTRHTRKARLILKLIESNGQLNIEELIKDKSDTSTIDILITEGIIKEEQGVIRIIKNADQISAVLRELSRGKLERIYSELLEFVSANSLSLHSNFELSFLIRKFGKETRKVVDRIAEEGLIEVKEVYKRRDPLRALEVIKRPPVKLLGLQLDAADLLRKAIDRNENQNFLLHGVTGSGKTEIYLDTLEHVINSGKRAIVLVPEIALTTQIIKRFVERFPGRIGVMHSGLTAGEAFDEWNAIAEGSYDVVIGSRSAIFSPQPNLGLIVIDESHEWTYKQSEPHPRYDARKFAIELGKQTNAIVIFGSATPDAENWLATQQGDFTRIDLPNRIRPVPQVDGSLQLWPVDNLPQIELVDMRGERRIFSDRFVEVLGETLDHDEQAILFLNRRGLNPFMLCSRGHTPKCTSCDIALAVHQTFSKVQRLVCHVCGREKQVPKFCVESGCGRLLKSISAGTQQVVKEVQQLFPNSRVVRWDRDSVRSMEDHRNALQKLLNHEADVLVGTQMIAKGFDLPGVTFVGVVLADYSLREGDFRSAEKTFQLLVQVAGRAGRSEQDGRVIVQTLQPEDPAIVAAVSQDTGRFYESDFRWRALHGYPPYSKMIRLLFSHNNLPFVASEARRVVEEIKLRAPMFKNISVIGPSFPAISRIRGKYRQQILVFGDDPSLLIRQMHDELPKGWIVDVDPLAVN
ncbi:MAG: primosomal protein N' [Chloroflexi bacterium]|nr:primosomal protein N' [Chloroflexota bacterium]